MKFILQLLFFMSLSGTMAFLFYWMMVVFADSCISAGFRYFSLKCCIAFLLIPFPLIKHLIFRVATPAEPLEGTRVYRNIQGALHQTSDGFFLLSPSGGQKIILAIWLFLLASAALYHLCCSLKFRNFIKHFYGADSVHKDTLEHLKKQMGTKKKIQLYYGGTSVSPFTCGVWKPVILLTEIVDDASVEMVLRHELQHIKSHDFFYRILGMLAVFLHCFNPVVFILFQELREVQEMNCDEKLLSRFSSEERQKYGHTILELATKEQSSHMPSIYFSRNDHRALQKRIRRIASFSRKKALVMTVLFAVMCILSFVPVYAYSPYTLDWRNDPVSKSELVNVDWSITECDADEADIIESPDEKTFQHTDEYFVTDDGRILETLPPYTPKASCSHTYTYVNKKSISAMEKGAV